MTQTGNQNVNVNQDVNMIQSAYNDVPLKTLLKGYRKRIIELINKSTEVNNILKNSLRNEILIVRYSSRSNAITNVEALRKMWGTLLDLTKYICNQLATDGELATIGGNATTKAMCNNVSALADKIKNYLNSTDIPKESDNDYDDDGNVVLNTIENTIGKYVSDLDDLLPYSVQNNVDWKLVITYGIFKQIYTQVYCALCDYNKYARIGGGSKKGTKLINTKVNPGHQITPYRITSAKDINLSLHQSKIKNLITWIDSRWDWRIPICCIDKMIIALDGYNNKTSYTTTIPKDIYNYLPTIIYFSRKCKSAPTAYISNIDFIKLFDTDAVATYVRCSKSIKQDVNGYYIDLVALNRKINFNNLTKYNSMTEDIWNHVIVHGANIYTPSAFTTAMKNGITDNQEFQEY